MAYSSSLLPQATWQFLSINMLSDNPKPHTVRDDMESMLYVVTYSGIRWLRHNWPDLKTRRVLVDLFDQWSLWPVAPNGGIEKYQNACNRKWTRSLEFDCPALNEWLRVFMDCHHRPDSEEETWQYEGWWQPTKMDSWWAEFLQTRGDRLYTADRVNRKLHHTSAQISDPPIPAVEATSTASLRGKRRVASAYAASPPAPSTLRRSTMMSWQPVRGMADTLPDVSVADSSRYEEYVPENLPQPPPRKMFKRRAHNKSLLHGNL